MPTIYGLPACECLAQWYPAFEAELRARGILPATKSIRVYQLIGGAVASAGVHATGGAGDDDQGSTEALWVARQMGADASWWRPYNWDGRNGMAHAHRCLTGCPHLSAVGLRQIAAVRAGRNGLASNGPDTGPRPLSGRTWQQGLVWQQKQAARRAERSRLTALIDSLRAKRAAIKVRIGTLVEKRKAL